MPRLIGSDLVNKVVAAEELLHSAKALMNDILKVSPVGVRYAKLTIDRGPTMDLANGLKLANKINLENCSPKVVISVYI